MARFTKAIREGLNPIAKVLRKKGKFDSKTKALLRKQKKGAK